MNKLLGLVIGLLAAGAQTAAQTAPAWEWAGWGGGGFFWSAVFHPTKDGVIYLGGDSAGVYKSEDHGRNWRLMNNGLADYAVYSLAVDRTAPQTVYAATEGGLCKSTDGGEQWRLLPNTGRKDLRITGERKRSIRCIAVDPTDGKIIYAGSPAGKVFKSTDGGETWQAIYDNIRVGSLQGGTIYSVAVAEKEPVLVLAATDDAGLVLSSDAGKTWRELATPKKASSVAVAPSDPNILYATFFTDGVWKSTDKGKTWKDVSQSLPKKCSLCEVAVSPTNPLDVYVIGAFDWNGRFFYSNNGGETWTESSQLTPDSAANPSLADTHPTTAKLSAPRNLAINPLNPKELYIAANWRPCHSADGGRTWTERVRGADISCVYDLRFHKGRTYAAAMDEGVFVSEDSGARWRALWPLRYDSKLGGHYWRLAISDNNGTDRIVSTCTSWNTRIPGCVVMSDDGGKTYTSSANGLPTTIPTANTMWGNGGPRALAADPKNPMTLYLGIDGDPSTGKSGGGVFKSEDGGHTWAALPGQPGSRRMFFGLAVDPTDSKRLFWGACATGGGLYRSEDGGASWQRVFKNETWVFNVHVTADGTIYCPGNNLWRSTDHGKNWKQLTKFPFSSRIIVAIETDPADAKRMWFAATTWGSKTEGDVYETRDAGATWQEITGNLPYRKPLLLRYNPDTRELWAAGVCLFKCRR